MKRSADASYEVILFTSNGQLVAIEIDYLVEILASVPVSPLPFVPSYVNGLVNINGRIMPQVDLADLIFGEKTGNDQADIEKTLLVVDIENVPIALKIDQVREAYTVQDVAISTHADNPAKDIQAYDPSLKKLSAYIAGSFAYQQETVLFFDAQSLKNVVRSTAEKPVGKQGFLGKVTEQKTETEPAIEYLLAEVADKEYAIDLVEVNEIVIMESIKSLPRAPDLVAGVGLVRGEPRLMLNLADLLGQSKTAGKVTAGAAIMVKFNDIHCGLLADRMVGLETIKKSQLKQDKDKQHPTVLREDGKTLTRVICFSSLFDNKILASIRPYLPNIKHAAQKIQIKQVEMLRFELDGDAYAFRLADIRRVVSGKPIEPLLSEKGYIMGTMELEGKVVPVINLISQLGYEQSSIPVVEYIVVNDNGREWGLGIHETDQIIKIDEPSIDAVKHLDARYIEAYTSYDEDLLTILNLKAICRDNFHAGAA